MRLCLGLWHNPRRPLRRGHRLCRDLRGHARRVLVVAAVSDLPPPLLPDATILAAKRMAKAGASDQDIADALNIEREAVPGIVRPFQFKRPKWQGKGRRRVC